jgi:two-component system chemotaxis sensor kinase CheA
MSGPDFDGEMFGELVSDFLDEGTQLLATMNQRLLHVEEMLRDGKHDAITASNNLELINEIFRAAHSLKGASAMLGLSNVIELTHRLENVLDANRSGQLDLRRSLVDVLFRCVDRLESMMTRLREEQDFEITSEDHAFFTWLDGELAGAMGVPPVEIAPSVADLTEPTPAIDVEAELEPDARENDGVLSSDVEDSFIEESSVEVSIELSESFNVEDEDEDDPATAMLNPDALPAGGEDIFDVSKYLSLYLDEADEEIDGLNQSLLKFEKNPSDTESLAEVFRMSHRLKGASAAMGLHEVKELTHQIETYFDQIRSGNRSLDERTINAIFESVDVLREFHRELRNGKGDPTALQQQTECIVNLVNPPEELEESVVTPVNDAPVSVAPSWNEEITGHRLVISFDPSLSYSSLKAALVLHRIETSGEVTFAHPTMNELESAETCLHLIVDVATNQSAEIVRRWVDVDGVVNVSIESHEGSNEIPTAGTLDESTQVETPAVKLVAETSALAPKVAEKSPARPAKETATEANGTSKVAETLRVEIERLDQLMNLAGELVINKARFAQIASGFQDMFRNKGAASATREMRDRLEGLASKMHHAKEEGRVTEEFDRLASEVEQLTKGFDALREEMDRINKGRQQLHALGEAIHQLTRIADGIQKSVMDTRMVPIGPLFSRFHRVVRDVARVVDKEVKLEIVGEKTELDKRMIDELGDPLIHLVRNAVDHGLETTDQRERDGKPRAGTVRLEAMHRGNAVVVQVKDDGRGIDPVRIRQKAIEKGLANQAELDTMSDKQILQFIWHAGFSTAKEITDISGRGVGLDIVRSKIEQLSGTIEVDSELGQGTLFTIRLPLTLAILPSLLSRIYDEVYAFPIECVEEIVAIPVKEIYTIQGIRTIRVRGRVISLVTLDDIFRWGDGPHPMSIDDREQKSSSKELTIVIVQSAGCRLGVVVDSLIGEEDVVIKSLAENFEHVRGLAGASILGDGRVSLILDLASMTELAQQASARLSA